MVTTTSGDVTKNLGLSIWTAFLYDYFNLYLKHLKSKNDGKLTETKTHFNCTKMWPRYLHCWVGKKWQVLKPHSLSHWHPDWHTLITLFKYFGYPWWMGGLKHPSVDLTCDRPILIRLSHRWSNCHFRRFEYKLS